MKLAVAVLSDPNHGSEESLGRCFNGLALAHDARAKGDEVAIVFAGAGTRWPGELTKLSHPLRALFDEVRDLVRGASCGCAEVFGATKSVEACGVPLLRENALPSTPGLASLRNFLADGFTVQTF
jgi:hypothetical protein